MDIMMMKILITVNQENLIKRCFLWRGNYIYFSASYDKFQLSKAGLFNFPFMNVNIGAMKSK